MSNPQIRPGEAGVTNLSTTLSGATNASPIVITATNIAGYNLRNNDVVTVAGVVGNTAANGTWVLGSVSVGASTTTAQLLGSTGNGAYSSGGAMAVEVVERVNAAWCQGWGNGFWPTNGGGLTLNLTPGGSFISGSVVAYAGGSLTMANGSTNYVYLDSSSGIPSSNTTGFTTSTIPIATVVTSGGAITSINDQRTMFFAGGGGGGSGVALVQTIHQVAHGFGTAGQWKAVYHDTSIWQLAKANNEDTLGIAVAVVIDTDNFYLYTEGLITGLSGLSVGEYYFVSDSTAGQLITTEPTSTSSYSNPLMQATSATTAQICEFRPSQIAPILPQPVPVLVQTGAGPITDPGGNDYYILNNYTSAITWNAPSAAIVGLQRIFGNYTGRALVLTVQLHAGDKAALFGVDGSSGGTLVSAGGAGDAIGLVCDASGHWTAFVIFGSWSTT
jgi:hypothetical protein